MKNCPNCIKYKEKIKILNERLINLERKPAIRAGLIGEHIVSILVDGVPTAFSSPHDVTTLKDSKRIEVKFSGLNIAYKGAKTKRWTWHYPWGARGTKKYNRLILIGEVDRDVNYEDAVDGPYIYFDVPFKKAVGLMREGGAIQISTNPRTARTPEARMLYDKYLVLPHDLTERYGL